MNITKQETRLGRGLTELGITELLSDINAGPTSDLRKISVDLIKPGKYQPRKIIMQEALQDLANSIKSQGLLQPIVVRSCGSNTYEIVAGERRWRASQLAGLNEIPVIIRETSDEQALALSLIENIQREDLNSIEEATALQRLIEEFSLTHQEVADAVGKSRTMVTNLLRLLNLQPEIQQMIERKEIEMGHGRALLTLPPAMQIQTARIILNKNLSVRSTEELVRKLLEGKSIDVSVRMVDPNVMNLQNDLSAKLGAKVNIQHTNKGNGKIIINYNSLDELEGIIENLVK